MLFQNLFLWPRRDWIQRKNHDEEGVRIVKRLLELSEPQQAAGVKTTSQQLSGPATRPAH